MGYLGSRVPVVAALAAAAVTLLLAWLAWHWRRVARRAPAGMRLYAREVARAARTAFALWTVVLTVTAAGLWLLPPLASGPEPLAAPEPSGPPGSGQPAPGARELAATTPAAGDEYEYNEYEYTEQPELPPGFAAVMAASLDQPGGIGPGQPLVVLEVGDVVIAGLEPATGEVALLNRSSYSVLLDEWSVAVRPIGGAGPLAWSELPAGLVLGPGAEIPIPTGRTGPDFGEVTLYNASGVILARLPDTAVPTAGWGSLKGWGSSR